MSVRATMYAQHLTEAEWTDYQTAFEVLERMEPLWQDVLRQRVEGYSWEEIAQVTGKPLGTLACGLERALEKASAGLGRSPNGNSVRGVNITFALSDTASERWRCCVPHHAR